MTRSPFPKSPTRKNSLRAFPIAQFLILGTVIIIFAAVFVQNLQILVQVFFLGQKTLPIPLSIAMLVAFVVGGLIAFVINTIASQQQNLAIRRGIVAAGSKVPDQETKEKIEPNNFASNDQPPSSAKSPTKQAPEFVDKQQEYEEEYDDQEYEDDWEDEGDDWEDEYEKEEYEDPDTVPYGDRKNLKSAKPNREKRDRPPLEARYIR